MGAIEEPRYAEASYWALLEATLSEVFNLSGTDARASIAERQRALANATPAERLLSFHAEPLYVAADIAGRTHDGHGPTVTPGQQQRYLTLAQSAGWRAGASHAGEVAAA